MTIVNDILDLATSVLHARELREAGVSLACAAIHAAPSRPDGQRPESDIGAVFERRRAEYAAGRICAELAMSSLGFPPSQIPTGVRGQPEWPSGLVGSITHVRGVAMAVVARRPRVCALGIDLEEVSRATPELHRFVSTTEDVARVAAAYPRGRFGDALLFSAKESALKALDSLGVGPVLPREIAISFRDQGLGFDCSVRGPEAVAHALDGKNVIGRLASSPEHVATTLVVLPSP